jgi:adenylate cyclase
MALRRFRSRLLVLIVGLLVCVQAVTSLVVSQTARGVVRGQLQQELLAGVESFDRHVADRMGELADKARLLAGDYALRETLLETEDPGTLASVLDNLQGRIDAGRDRVRTQRIVLLDTEGVVLAATGGDLSNAAEEVFLGLVLEAEESVDDPPSAAGLASVEGVVQGVLVLPVFAPRPVVVGWLGYSFPLDGALAQRIKAGSSLDVSFLEAGGVDRVSVSTLSKARADALADALAAREGADASEAGRVRSMRLDGKRFLSLEKPLALVDGTRAQVVFQRSLDDALAPVRRLEGLLIATTLGGLVLASLVAMRLAREVSAPLQRLAAHTRVIARGDYETSIQAVGTEEFEQLAGALERMSAGLAERDRVRDLLDKNVSPEVAAWLMRDGAALGGEEREVTILFSDLRGFSSFCEGRGPAEVVGMLNRYLARMSAAIEAEGGVIDKFIGDAIMAVFGAPVGQADAADRALRAALGMRAALQELNREFAQEGRPAFGFGVGVNTARVIAGNIGSPRRLNYSVIGDGVNVAARLQSLTRRDDFATDILTSATTLAAARASFSTRALGTVEVKGRTGLVEVFAIDGVVP